jgi:hypothetical protein
MKENRTRIAIILDRSGSMASVRESTVAGFNQFIRSQREIPGDVSVKLIQFDDQYDVVFDKPLAEVPELTQDRFVPRGSTALFDAQGKTIVSLGQEIAAMPESERPSKVIVMTLTDGLENASKEYSVDKIAEMIKHQTEVYSWDFVFLGANQDAIHTAATMAIPAAQALTYAATAPSMTKAFRAVSEYVGTSRAGAAAAFSVATRKAVLEEEDAPLPRPSPRPAPSVRA